MNKTAMQELINDYKNELKNGENTFTNDEKYILKWVIDVAEQKLEKEKEQIIDAHIEGQRVFDNHTHTQWTNDQAEEYYNQTYNKNK